MDEAPDNHRPQKRGALLLSVLAGLCLTGLLFWAESRGLLYANYRRWRAPTCPLLYGLLAVMVVALAQARGPRRHALLLAGSVAGGGALLGLLSLPIFAYAVGVAWLARRRRLLGLRLALVLLAWLALPLCKWGLTKQESLHFYLFFLIWASLPFAAIYLLVERARGVHEGPAWRDVLYLTALPRWVAPFYQPISPRLFFASERVEPDARSAWHGVALGVIGIAFHAMLAKGQLARGAEFRAASALGFGELWINNAFYALSANAAHSFTGIAVLRVLGFALPSGFRFPWLANSWADFFRRWNSYIYEAVLSLFFVPLWRWVSPRMPRAWAGFVAGYASIFLGAYGLSYFLLPLSIATSPRVTLLGSLDPQRFGFASVIWILLLLTERLGSLRGRPILQRAVFWIPLLALMTTIWLLDVRLL